MSLTIAQRKALAKMAKKTGRGRAPSRWWLPAWLMALLGGR